MQFANSSTVVSNPYFSVSASASASSTAGATSRKSATIIASNLSQKEAISKMNKLLKKHKLVNTPSTAVTTYKLTGTPQAIWSGISIRGNNAIACVGDYTVSSNNHIYYSSDGGITWYQSTVPTYQWSSVSIGDLKALASNVTFQSKNTLYYSTNSGNSWSSDNDTVTILNVTISGEHAIKVTTQNGFLTPIYYANDASTSTNIKWNLSKTNIPSYVSAVSNSDSNAVLCEQSGNIYYSNDSGENWRQSNNSPLRYWFSVSISGSNAVACDKTSKNTYYSSDYGVNWFQSNTLPSSCNCVSISGNYAVAGGNGGSIYYSDDSGKNWKTSNSIQDAWWRISIDGANAVACVYGGNIYYSTDYGETWTQS